MANKVQKRYGIGEWYGSDFARLGPERIRELAKADFRSMPCRFRGGTCSKQGGVCTLRVYSRDGQKVEPEGGLVTVCPHRFKEASEAIAWIAKTLIGTDAPECIREVPFLKSDFAAPGSESQTVGQVDLVLVNQTGPVLEWCCVEMQAVYFSGPAMSADLAAFALWAGPGLPFPQKLRRPDFRSSGPKRLMPQLQTKVPTISRWGKKMAVLVDSAFWSSLARMEEVSDPSNCDVAWFVVDYEPSATGWHLTPKMVHFTTLLHAVEGLTGGHPVSLGEFEDNIKLRLAQSRTNPAQ
jgi:hypothetical protein